MQMESGLPDDLIMDLLSRLPIKTLLRFKAVSKGWSSLVSSTEFVKWHLNQSLLSLKHRIILSSASNYNLISFYCEESRNFDDLSAYFDDLSASELLKRPSFVRVNSIVLGSCNGLICISMFGFKVIHLWNPSTREYKKIPSVSIGDKEFVARYGFGYDTKTDDYQIVFLVTSTNENSEPIFKVFSLRNNTWRSSQCTTTIKCFVSSAPLAVYLDGTFYWIGKKSGKTKRKDEFQIASFNLGDETLKEITVPDIENGFRPSLLVINDHLFFSVFLFNPERVQDDIWMMLQCELDLSFIKVSYICRNHAYALYDLYPLCCTRQCEIIFGPINFKNVRRWLVIWNAGTGTFRMLRIGPGVIPTVYLETLVSPNTFCRIERS